jgi:hypothetical protein
MFVNKLGKAQLKFRRRNVDAAGSIMRHRKTMECSSLNLGLFSVPPTEPAYKRDRRAASAWQAQSRL